jgi:hypothetical protein
MESVHNLKGQSSKCIAFGREREEKSESKALYNLVAKRKIGVPQNKSATLSWDSPSSPPPKPIRKNSLIHSYRTRYFN